MHGIAASDAYVLYRLVARPITDKDWATLFGGGVKKQLKVITAHVLPVRVCGFGCCDFDVCVCVFILFFCLFVCVFILF